MGNTPTKRPSISAESKKKANYCDAFWPDEWKVSDFLNPDLTESTFGTYQEAFTDNDPLKSGYLNLQNLIKAKNQVFQELHFHDPSIVCGPEILLLANKSKLGLFCFKEFVEVLLLLYYTEYSRDKTIFYTSKSGVPLTRIQHDILMEDFKFFNRSGNGFLTWVEYLELVKVLTKQYFLLGLIEFQDGDATGKM
jgi:hypothetical protein